MSLTFAIDLDETCANLLDKYLDIYNKENPNFKLFRKNLRQFDMVENLRYKYGFKYESLEKELISIFNRDGLFDDLPLINNCKEIINKWHSEGHKIFFVTNAMFAPNSMISKFNWVKKHFPYAIPVFTPDKSIVSCDIAIDDNVDYLSQYNSTIEFLIDAPYNQECELGAWQQYRVKDFNDIDKILRKDGIL